MREDCGCGFDCGWAVVVVVGLERMQPIGFFLAGLRFSEDLLERILLRRGHV